MSWLITSIGASFFAAFMWREILIGAPALWAADPDRQDMSLMAAYYGRVTRTPLTRGALAIAALTTSSGLTAALMNGAGTLRAVAGFLLLGTTLLTSATVTWPAAWRLGGARSDDTKLAHRLVRYQVLMFAMLACIVVIPFSNLEGRALLVGIVAACAGFNAGTMWNEVLVDWPASRGSRERFESYAPTLLDYYAVMTRTRRTSNIVALSLGVGGMTIGVIGLLVIDPASWAHRASLSLIVLLALLASRKTWPAAVRLGNEAMSRAEQYRVARPLGAWHLALVVALLGIAAVEVSTVA